jgi:hypothetical protein
MANPSTSEILVTTLTSQKKKIVSNIKNQNALLFRLNEKGNIKQRSSGGESIRESITYRANATVQYQGEYDTLNTTPQDIITAANYNWKMLTGTVTMSGLEKHKNAGPEKIFDLMSSKLKNLTESVENTVNASLYSDGTTALEIGGLQQLIADDPTTGTVGGIDRSTNTFWRNKIYDFSVETVTPSATTMIGSMNVAWLRCLVQGNKKPDLLLADTTYYSYYESALQSILRVGTSKMADAGFEALKYKSADVVQDNDCPSEHMYMLNTDHIFLRYLGKSLFNVNAEKASFNQDAASVPLVMYGNMSMDNARTSCVMHA